MGLREIMLETETSVVDSRENVRYWQKLYMDKAGSVNWIRIVSRAQYCELAQGLESSVIVGIDSGS